jgi:RNA polymerase sigma-70 factor (ECF subfamily)
MRDFSRTRDEWLALRCQAGVPGAFADLLGEMERPLFYYAVKITGNKEAAIDLLQEVWLRALRDIRKLRDPSAVRSWLYTIAHGIGVDSTRQARSNQRLVEHQAETLEIADDPWPSIDDAAAVHHALDKLDSKHREVLVLHFLEDFSLIEISKILDCPEGTVKSRIYYAKKALREAITGGSHEQGP